MSSQTVRVVHRFQTSAERVFDAWLDQDRIGKFLFATPHGTMVKVAIDEAGFTIVERRGGQDFEHVGRFLQRERPRLIAFAFAAGTNGQRSPETPVRVEIAPLESGCELTLAHEGVPGDFVEQGQRSWATILANLDHHVRPGG